jgi:K+/H+ antiporter YhaU regulatory subunit KhtT
MITELKEVITKVEKLNNEEQKQIAKMLEEEINWDSTLEKNKEQLRNLAEEAIQEYKTGKTQKKDW